MFRLLSIVGVCFILIGYPGFVLSNDVIHHKLDVQIEPFTATLTVEDTITFPSPASADRLLPFVLHRNLKIGTTSNIIQTHDEQTFPAVPQNAAVPLKRYSIQISKGQRKISLKYSGKIAHNTQPSSEEYARFNGTPGLIDAQGVFLARSTAWFPRFAQDGLLSFRLKVQLPETWDVVSQGVRTEHTVVNSQRNVVWTETLPQDDIYLIAGQYKAYSQGIGATTAMVFMREADDALAQQYLDVTGQYIAMYSRLIGPYPYNKFALVENFWETGYGMPSFTLLGPKVMRFPFIMHSSYPHEILHNWWGNGVFVDYDNGNWAEGLTAYLADHLIKEQRGQGAQHRRSVLQKYTDFVSAGQDFPLTDFISRHSSATEAVGYGKTLMFFHMLRQAFGDVDFTKSLAHFYRRFNGKVAGFNDIQTVMSNVLEKNLQPVFEQWVARTGAPTLNLLAASVSQNDSGHQLSFTIEQTQMGEPYRLSIPVAVHLQGRADAHQAAVFMTKRQQKFSFTLSEKPYRLDVDPEFDIFRRLHAAEIPAALSQGFGAEQVLVLLPSKADSVSQAAYRSLAERWQRSQAGDWRIKLDSDIESLPKDKTVWLLGWRNRFQSVMDEALKSQNVDVSVNKVRIAEREFEQNKHSVLLAVRNPKNTNQTFLWLGAGHSKAIPGLSRKLPHYRKYSYLVFDGDEPNNIDKGQWSTVNSPMTILFKQNNGAKKVRGAHYAARRALAQLPPAAFSQTALPLPPEHLASVELEGRSTSIGIIGLDKGVAYLAE
ncbi:MAG: M1 family metallopeptidase [Gammaproteobacteria bacterium]|nr:M1 family metallopeptidase [Gammaproteobacteria bacterium]